MDLRLPLQPVIAERGCGV